MDTRNSATKGLVPPRQHNLQTAAVRAVEALRGQSPEQMDWLGAGAVAPDVRELAVLDGAFTVDLATGNVSCRDGRQVGAPWRILALHYLAIRSRPRSEPPEIAFADIPGARAYAPVYQARVIRRLCAAAGRDLASLRAGALAVRARPVAGGDAAFDLAPFPRLLVRLVWYAPDDEFPPSAVLLMPRNIESFLCVEDIVVLSEGIVSRLCGRPF